MFSKIRPGWSSDFKNFLVYWPIIFLKWRQG
jgi:hypothetical protein